MSEDFVDLIHELEEAFAIDLPAEVVSHLHAPEQLAEYIHGRVDEANVTKVGDRRWTRDEIAAVVAPLLERHHRERDVARDAGTVDDASGR